MNAWKTILLVLTVAAALYFLYPARQLTEQDTAGVVEIVYMGPGGPIAGAMEDAVREFERLSEQAHRKDPNRPIYRVISGQNAARDQVADPTRFLVSVAGNSPPDVIWFDRYAVTEWSSRGAFEPLDGYIARDGNDIRTGRRTDLDLNDVPTADKFYKSCWDEAMYKDQVYAIPASVDTRALFYNKDLLRAAKPRLLDLAARAPKLPEAARRAPLDEAEQKKLMALGEEERLLMLAAMADLNPAGILVDPSNPETSEVKPPESWEALWVYAIVLTQKDEAGKLKGVGFAPQFGNSWLYMYGWMAGGEFMSADGTQCTLNDSRIVDALAFMRNVYDSIAPRGQNGYEYVSSFQAGFGRADLDPFIQGKVAMKIDGAWNMSGLAIYGRDLNFGVADPPLPRYRITPQRQTISWAGGWAYAIPRVAKNKDAAWEFIRFMMSPRAQRIRVESEKEMAEAQGRPYVPSQVPHIGLNEAFFKEYVYDNPQLARKYKDGCRKFNDLLPVARFRPVTPVGQLLWNEQITSMEAGLYGTSSPRDALDYGARNVQRALDRILNPPPGDEIRSWTWFFLLYGGLLVLAGVAVYLWDTRAGFRSKIAALFRRRQDRGVIEGARGGYFRGQWFGGFVCAAPWIIGFVIFAGGPMLFSIIMSFCDFDVLNPARFIGVENYQWMFTSDQLFPLSLWNTAYMVIGVPVGMALSLAIALLMNAKVRGISVWRTFFYLPAIVPLVAASVLWIQIFNPQQGFLNKFLDLIGIEGPKWLQNVHWSKPALILMGLWGAGGGMIIWLAGLKGINQQLYEAASVDGAGAWRKFLHITLPQMTPYVFFNLVMGMIGTFQIFGSAFIMTQGGPQNSTLFYVYHLFNNAFRYGRMGYASAMAWVLFVIVLILTIFQLKGSKRWVYYESE